MNERTPDAIDHAILTVLRSDARTNITDVGNTVLLSRNAVRKRILRLERDGFIHGYTIRETKPTPGNIAAVLLVYRHDRLRGGDVIAGLRAIPEIVTCDVVSGALDLVIRVETNHQDRIGEIWRLIAEWPGVRDITTAVSLDTVIDARTR